MAWGRTRLWIILKTCFTACMFPEHNLFQTDGLRVTSVPRKLGGSIVSLAKLAQAMRSTANPNEKYMV